MKTKCSGRHEFISIKATVLWPQYEDYAYIIQINRFLRCYVYLCIGIETGSGHLGQPGDVLSL